VTVDKFIKHRDCITSRSGGWTIGGETTMHGYNIHQQLGPHASWMQTMFLSVIGRLLTKSEAEFVEKIFILTGYPDPRLWCNRVASLAGSARATAVSSFAAGIASAEARMYGRQSDYLTSCMLQKAKQIFDDSGSEGLSEFIRNHLKSKRVVYGYGRPLIRKDERIIPLSREAKKLGLEEGGYLSIAYKIEEIIKKYKMTINYGGYVMARMLDLGLSPKEIYRASALGFYLGIVPCYIEAFENEPGTFLPIACEDILYEGVEERELP